MTARLISNVDKVLRIQARERLPLLWLTLYATAAIGGVLTIGLSVSTSLFLSQLPASATAVIFVVSGIFLATTVLLYKLLYNRFSARVHFARLVIVSSIILALLALVRRHGGLIDEDVVLLDDPDESRAPHLHARLADEMREVYRWALLSEDLKQASPGDLLIDAVARRSRAGLLRLLWLLAALHPGSGLVSVLRASAVAA